MGVWSEFYKTPKFMRYGDDATRVEILASEFATQHYSDILAEIKGDVRSKTRLAFPFKFFLDQSGIVSATLQASTLNDLTIVSMAPQWACQASVIKEFEHLTSEGTTFGRSPDRTLIEMPACRSFGAWLLMARPLIDAGLVTFLPNEYSEDKPNPHNPGLDPVSYQQFSIARNLEVARQIGASIFVPSAFGGMGLNAYNAVMSKGGQLFATLPSIDLTSLSFAELAILRIEEEESFRKLRDAWRSKVNESAEKASSDDEFQKMLRINEQILFKEPFESFKRKADRLGRSFKKELAITVGISAVAAIAANASSLVGFPIAAGGLGAVTLVTFVQRMMDWSRRYSALLYDNDKTFQIKLGAKIESGAMDDDMIKLLDIRIDEKLINYDNIKKNNKIH